MKSALPQGAFNLPPGCSTLDIEGQQARCDKCDERIRGEIHYLDDRVLCGLCADDVQQERTP